MENIVPGQREKKRRWKEAGVVGGGIFVVLCLFDLIDGDEIRWLLNAVGAVLMFFASLWIDRRSMPDRDWPQGVSDSR